MAMRFKAAHAETARRNGEIRVVPLRENCEKSKLVPWCLSGELQASPKTLDPRLLSHCSSASKSKIALAFLTRLMNSLR
jgi:hypothetical protein